jgi:hypothetical protein
VEDLSPENEYPRIAQDFENRLHLPLHGTQNGHIDPVDPIGTVD